MGKYDEHKYAAIGLLSQGVPVGAVARQLDIPTRVLAPWKIEADLVASKASLESAINMDTDVIDGMLHDMPSDIDTDEAIIQYLAETVTNEDVDIVTTDIVDRIDGLQVLQTDMQTCATKLVSSISKLAVGVRDPKELQLLTDSLSKLQLAFFAKGTNVNVLNMQAGVSDSSLSAFTSMKREA